MKWRIVSVEEGQEQESDLTSDELVGVSVLLTHQCGEPRDVKFNVYWRAREKMQPQVMIALDDHD